MFEIFQVTQPATGVVLDLSPYLAQIFLAVVTAVTAFVGKAARDFVVANKNDKNFGLVTDIVEVAVQAAEQLYARQSGDAKKQFALDYAEAWLASKGIKVETDELATAIEAAVLREFNYPQSVEPATPPTETVVEVAPSSPSDDNS